MKAWVALVLSLSIPFRILSITLGDLGLEREAQTRRDLNEDESAEELPHPYSDRKATAHSTPINYQDCPANYPDYGRQGDLLRAWSPNEPHAPEGLRESLKVFNYSDPSQRAEAAFLRDCAVPFKIYGVPLADEASQKWTDEYLAKRLGDCSTCNVMKSESNRFMFWHRVDQTTGRNIDWNPPTTPVQMPFSEWRAWTKEAEERKIGPDDTHYYLTTGVPASAKMPAPTGFFVADDLPFFSTNTENFFITDVERQKGIQCRFGARGIIAESHFDHGQNFVLMLRGRKRYLLNPPVACPSLGIISDRRHPSFRHSGIDWSNESEWPEGFVDAPALDTVVKEGELLFIPSFWYHYIVSEGFSVQCNARSGQSLRPKWKDQTESCLGHKVSPQKKLRGRGRPSVRPERPRMNGPWL